MSSPKPDNLAMSRRVLIADDDPFYREIAVATLVDAGFNVSAAADGAEAFDLISANTFDIAVVDVMMPVMTGLEFIAKVRATETSRNLPIIVITGNDDTESIQTAYDSGATSFLAKPLNWPLFVHHVNFVLKSGLAENDLRDAIRTAEFLSDLKTRVNSVLVGEFQAPLRTAQGMSELLRKEVYGPLGNRIYLEYAEDLHKALDQLNATQLRMMTSSRVMSNEVLLKEEVVVLNEMIVESLQSMRQKADRRGIDIQLRGQLPPGLRLACDRSLMSQTFKMLIEGAVQSSPRNSSIVMTVGLDAGGAFCFTIEDQAPSLPDTTIREILNVAPVARPVAQQQVFARNTSLTICRVLLEAHQGTMTLKSTPGDGTRVQFTVPVARLLCTDDQLPTTPAVPDVAAVTLAVAKHSIEVPALQPIPTSIHASASLHNPIL